MRVVAMRPLHPPHSCVVKRQLRFCRKRHLPQANQTPGRAAVHREYGYSVTLLEHPPIEGTSGLLAARSIAVGDPRPAWSVSISATYWGELLTPSRRPPSLLKLLARARPSPLLAGAAE